MKMLEMLWMAVSYDVIYGSLHTSPILEGCNFSALDVGSRATTR